MGSGTTAHGLPYPLETDAFDPAADMQQSMTAVDTNYEGAYAHYHPHTGPLGVSIGTGQAGSAGTAPLVAPGAAPLAIGASIGQNLGFYIDPADLTAASRTTKLRVRALLSTNAVAPGVTLTVALYPATINHGASGSGNVLTLGPPVTGSAVVYTTPSASTDTDASSGDIAVPAAGIYLLGWTASGAVAANSVTNITARLQYRHV